MSKILLVQILFLYLNFSNYNSIGQVELLDTISPKDLCISDVLIGANTKVLLNTFGKPDSIISHIDEFEGTEFQEYVYMKSSFYISGNNFTSFDVRDSIFQFDYGKIKVGDSIEKTKNIFPKSYDNREIGESEITIRVKIDDTDSYVLFICDNQVIKRIMSWDDL
jgi:hypothetical protein